MIGNAPASFAAWLSKNTHRSKGRVYRNHPRSESHSIALCQRVLKDLLDDCEALRADAASGQIVYKINCRSTWPKSNKTKMIDLAIGRPVMPPKAPPDDIVESDIADCLISFEAKTVMTEHAKSQPRLFDELSSSHEIVHMGNPRAIAAGLAVVNIADTFVSPLRQKGRKLFVSRHKQPHVAERMIEHLRGLQIREMEGGIGFDAFAAIVVFCENTGPTSLWTSPPAPQPGDVDHYDTFLKRISDSYRERFA
jgi:hypothetical protein